MAAQGDRPLHRRLAWFALLWLAGIAAVGAVAWIIRLLLGL
jgi:preprotein translocase subunit Sss1